MTGALARSVRCRAMGDERRKQPQAEPPGEGEGIDEASEDAVRELRKRGEEGHAGTGDIG